MELSHYSDCALHNLPARFPMPCDCALNATGWRAYLELSHYRWCWKQENHASLYCFVRTLIMKRDSMTVIIATGLTCMAMVLFIKWLI